MVPFTIRNLSKREKGYSAAITACWGHPILANPKEPLNVSFSFSYFFFLEFEKERTRGTHLCGLGISAARRQLRFPWDFWVIVVIAQAAQLEGQLLPYCGRILNVGYSLSIALVHLIYARKPFGSIRFHVRSYSIEGRRCAHGGGEKETEKNKGSCLVFIMSFELQIFLFFSSSVELFFFIFCSVFPYISSRSSRNSWNSSKSPDNESICK